MHTIEYLQTFRLKKLKKGVSVPPCQPPSLSHPSAGLTLSHPRPGVKGRKTIF